MKRSELGDLINEKLRNSENLFKGYAKGSISLKCLCDNLEYRMLNIIEKAGMLPPSVYLDHLKRYDNSWEPEDGDK